MQDYEISDEDLKHEFEYYGPVVKARIVKDSETGKSKGYGFVEFESSRDLKGKLVLLKRAYGVYVSFGEVKVSEFVITS